MNQPMEVRMAKADDNDLAVVRGFIDYLNDVVETGESDYEEGVERFQAAEASIERVVLGYEVLRDSFCDPDVSYLRFNPRLQAAARDEVLREAINAMCSECRGGVPLADLPGYAHWKDGGRCISSCDAAPIHELRGTIPSPYPRPRVVCLCGSTRFWRTFQMASLAETMAGRIVLSIGAASGTDDDHFGNLPREEYDRVKAELDELHKRKIDMADEVLVLNVEGYIGDSTRSEVQYAIAQGKPVRWLEPDRIPDL